MIMNRIRVFLFLVVVVLGMAIISGCVGFSRMRGNSSNGIEIRGCRVRGELSQSEDAWILPVWILIGNSRDRPVAIRDRMRVEWRWTNEPGMLTSVCTEEVGSRHTYQIVEPSMDAGSQFNNEPGGATIDEHLKLIKMNMVLDMTKNFDEWKSGKFSLHIRGETFNGKFGWFLAEWSIDGMDLLKSEDLGSRLHIRYH